MSMEALTWAWSQTVGGGRCDKLVLLALADYADENWQSFPSRRRLAERAECSVDSVDRALKRLEAAGLIGPPQRRPHDRGGLSSNLYTLLWDAHPPSRNLRPPLAADCGQSGRTHAATLAAQAAATGTKNLTNSEKEDDDGSTSGGEACSPPEPAPTVAARLPEPRMPLFDQRPRKERRRAAAEHPAVSPADITACLDAYNAAAKRHGWHQATQSSEERTRRLAKRLAAIGANGTDCCAEFTKALESASRDDFCMGRVPPKSGRPFVMSLGYLLRAKDGDDVLVRLIEAADHAGAIGSTLDETVPDEIWEAAIREETCDMTRNWTAFERLGTPFGHKSRVPRSVADRLGLTRIYDAHGLLRSTSPHAWLPHRSDISFAKRETPSEMPSTERSR